MNRLVPALVVAASLALAPAALAETLRVPSAEYPTIQSAVDAAADGDEIVVSGGPHEESVLVDDRPGITIRGSGNPVVRAPAGEPGIRVQGSERVTLTGLVVEGGVPGIAIAFSRNARVEKVTVRNTEGVGIHLTNCQFPVLSKCRVEDAAQEGIRAESPRTLLVEKCVVDGSALAGIEVSNAASEPGSGNATLISRNRVSNSGGAGIAFSGREAILEKNRVTAAAGTGIRATGTPDVAPFTMEKNSVKGAGDGVVVDGGQALVSKNKVSGHSGTGLALDGPAGVAVKNRVAGGDTGVRVSGEGGHTLEKNAAKAAAVDGFLVTSPGNTFTKNKAKRSGRYDLWDQQGEGVSTYDRNKFGTTEFGD